MTGNKHQDIKQGQEVPAGFFPLKSVRILVFILLTNWKKRNLLGLLSLY